MKKIAHHIGRLVGFSLMVWAVTCFTACSKDDVATDNIDAAPLPEKPVADKPVDKKPAPAYTLSVPAAIGVGNGDTRAVTFSDAGVTTFFEYTDQVFIYCETEVEVDGVPVTKKLMAFIANDNDNNLAFLSPKAGTINGVNCTLECNTHFFFRETPDGENVAVNPGDQVRLFYNASFSLLSQCYEFNYSTQCGGVVGAQNSTSEFDYAEAEMAINTFTGDESSGYSIELCKRNDATMGTANFKNLQSMFRFSFTGLPEDVGIERVIISSPKLVSTYRPTISTLTSENPAELLQSDYGDVTIVLDNDVRLANGHGVVYASLRFDPTDSDLDVITFTVTDTEGHVFSSAAHQQNYPGEDFYFKKSEIGGFKLSKYYEAEISLQHTVNLASITGVNSFTAQTGDVLKGSLPTGVKLLIGDNSMITFSNISVTAPQAIELLGDATIYLEEESESFVRSTGSGQPGILVGTDLIVRGHGFGTGKLTVESDDGEGLSVGGNLRFENANLDVAGASGTYGTIHVNNDMYVKGHVVVESGNGVHVGNNLTIDRGSIIGTAGSGHAGIYVGGTLIANGGTVKGLGNGDLPAIEVNELLEYHSYYTVEVIATGGTGLNASEVTLTYGYITAVGGEGNTAMTVTDQLSVTGGDLKATGGTGAATAMTVNAMTVTGGKVTANGAAGGLAMSVNSATISGGEVTANGGNAAKNSNGNGGDAFYGAVTVSGGKLTAVGGNKDGSGTNGMAVRSGSTITTEGNIAIYAGSDGSHTSQVAIVNDEKYVVVKRP